MTWPSIVATVLGLAGPAAAGGEEPQPLPVDVEEIADGDFLIDPPALEGPPARTPRLRTQIYADAGFVQMPDLSSLVFVEEGSAQILRFGLGGSLRLRDVEVQLYVPYTDVTTVHLKRTQRGGRPIDQTVVGFGDVRAGAVWRHVIPYYPPKMLVGASLGGLVSTHTTKFRVETPTGDDKYVPPHYWQVEAAGLFATAFGPMSLVTSQGGLALLGQDVDYTASGIGVKQEFPEMYFWDAHWTAGMHLGSRLGLTLDVQTVVQVNTVVSPPPPSPQFDSVLNDIRAIYLNPGVQIYLGSFKLDLAGRLGLGKSADTFGVASLTGSRSAMVRLTRSFDYDAMAGSGGSSAGAGAAAAAAP